MGQVLVPDMGGAVLVLFLGVLSIGSAKHVGRMRQAPAGHSCGDGHSHGGCANGEDTMMNLEAAPVQMEQKTRRAALIPRIFRRNMEAMLYIPRSNQMTLSRLLACFVLMILLKHPRQSCNVVDFRTNNILKIICIFFPKESIPSAHTHPSKNIDCISNFGAIFFF